MEVMFVCYYLMDIKYGTGDIPLKSCQVNFILVHTGQI